MMMKKRIKFNSPLEQLLVEKKSLQKDCYQAIMDLDNDWLYIRRHPGYLLSEWISSRLLTDWLYFI